MHKNGSQNADVTAVADHGSKDEESERFRSIPHGSSEQIQRHRGSIDAASTHDGLEEGTKGAFCLAAVPNIRAAVQQEPSQVGSGVE